MTFTTPERLEALRLIVTGLAEDLGDRGDITSAALFDGDEYGRANLVVRQSGVIAGLEILDLIAEHDERGLVVERRIDDGPAERGTVAAVLSGPLPTVLCVERLALNLIGRLSGVATLTAKYVAKVTGTKAKVCDTRKTTPGFRRLEKYAVRIGGGTNHRVGLFDGVLIKDNHLAGLAERSAHPVRDAVRRARERAPKDAVLEVEVDSPAQLEEALPAGPDIVLLDNMDVAAIRAAVARRDAVAPRVLLEASGGVNLETIAGIAATGVDRISVGALTHSAPCLDVALDYRH
jgi:nicotinate-nucleotide pyrophosphorylase (carboxylating)